MWCMIAGRWDVERVGEGVVVEEMVSGEVVDLRVGLFGYWGRIVGLRAFLRHPLLCHPWL